MPTNELETQMNFLSSNRKYFSRFFKLSKLFFVLCLATFVLVGFSPGGNEATPHDTCTALDETHGGLLPPGSHFGAGWYSAAYKPPQSDGRWRPQDVSRQSPDG